MTNSIKPIKPTVALVRCSSYDPGELDLAVAQGLAFLGGAKSLFEPQQKLLLKPNVLIGENPDKHVTTHPAVFAAVARALKDAGAQLTYGDSPAFGPPSLSTSLAGIAAEAEKLGIPLADFVNGQEVPFPKGMLIKQFLLAKGVLEADAVVCLPKFKTHALTRITGAVKNLFGCIPGLTKSEFHANLMNEVQFGRMLYDLSRLINSPLCIMDAVVGMEGNGPRNGTPRQLNLLIFSNDATALDVVMARLINLDPLLVPTLAAAQVHRPGILEDIVLVGEDLDACRIPDFDVNRNPGSTTLKKGFWSNALRQLASPRPVIDPGKCRVCGTCVQICPVRPKALSFQNNDSKSMPVYNYDLCIRCYCCQETCPYDAIYVKTPLLGKIIH